VRLHPPVTEEEALEWLTAQASARWDEISRELQAALGTLAKAMASVSAADLPEDVEPNLL
jgi:hypothetical protein